MSRPSSSAASTLADGFAVVNDVLAAERCVRIAALLDEADIAKAGTRCMLELPWCRDLADAVRRHPAVAELLQTARHVCQCTYFHKSAAKNWLVAWHQDLSVPVTQRVDADGWSAWSVNEGTTFVQPPASVLEELVAVRIHIDPSHAANGPLRVIAGSHRHGRLAQSQIVSLCREGEESLCRVPAGGALLMRPLLLHASSKCTSEEPRRVLHFLYGRRELPDGVQWRVEPAPPLEAVNLTS